MSDADKCHAKGEARRGRAWVSPRISATKGSKPYARRSGVLCLESARDLGGQAARGRQEVERQGVVIEGRQQDVNEVEEAGD